jgi:hypothetical protein
LEDEGFYVGPRPYVKNSNLNRMENRLLKEAGRNAAPEDEEADAGQTIPGVLLEVSSTLIDVTCLCTLMENAPV